MTDDGRLLALLTGLGRCTCFEDAADTVLDTALTIVDAAVSRSEYAGNVRGLRATVHVRPEDAYRRYAVREPKPSRRSEGLVADATPSSTAWRLLREHGARLSIDVTTGTTSVAEAGRGDGGRDIGRFDGRETRARLLDREITHVLALPLRRPGGPIEGMISIEASCRAAIGRGFAWNACTDVLAALVDLSAPYLLGLPMRTSGAPDDAIPVVGKRMAEVVEVLRAFAAQEETLLLHGPTGTGKSRLAQWCHEHSAVRRGPFEVVELANVPEDMQFGLLVGWKRGAFTSAVRDGEGAIARASGGTLFLDEIDKLSLGAQTKLLRLLETRRYRPLGADGAESVANVRFIVATNARLADEVTTGRFREDLYYRVNVLPVSVPALRDRSDEIAGWARHMLGGDGVLTDAAADALAAQPWPGNLRQLHNVVRRAFAMTRLDEAVTPPVVDERHVRRALDLDPRQSSTSLAAAFRAAASAFIERALAARAGAAGADALELDDAEAIRAFVLERAIAATGSREQAYRLLGKGQIVENRNHQKSLRQELERARGMLMRAGEDPKALDALDERVTRRS